MSSLPDRHPPPQAQRAIEIVASGLLALTEQAAEGAREVADDAPKAPPLLTPADCATRLAVSRSMVYALIKRGDIRALYIGRLPRVESAELDRYIERARR
jgi:excisionase family DNA binding protein